MGTDCKAYAKLKDGTYRRRSLDRLYCFNTNEFDHPPIFVHNPNAEFFSAEQHQFTLEHGLDWCVTRLNKLIEVTPEEAKREGVDLLYHIHWVRELHGFLNVMRMHKMEVEWVALYADSDNHDYDLETTPGVKIIQL